MVTIRTFIRSFMSLDVNVETFDMVHLISHFIHDRPVLMHDDELAANVI